MIIKKFEIYCIHILFFFFFYQTTFPSKKQSKEKKSFERKQAKKQKKTKKKSVIHQRTLFIPPQCPCPRIIIIGIRLINRDQGQARPGREGTSRSSRLGLLYVHCARAFTPLNTQRHGARFHGVGVYKQGGQRQGTWCPDRERERERREVVDHPQNGLPTFTHFVYDEPRLWQRYRGSFVPPGTALGSTLFSLSTILPRIIRLDRVASLRDSTGQWWLLRFSKWGGLRMGMLFKSNRCWKEARVEYVCVVFIRNKNIKKMSYCRKLLY